MKLGNRLQQLEARVRRPRFLLAAGLAASATEAFARQPNVLPEPSVLSLVGVAAVVGIIAYRIRKKK
jgi:hypothetical protein